MTEALNNSLIITLIGMGLVFIAILILWAMMELLVRLSADRGKGGAVPPTPAVGAPHLKDGIDWTGMKEKVAAVAVAFALGIVDGNDARVSQEDTGQISPWQSVMRAGQINQQNSIHARKDKGA